MHISLCGCNHLSMPISLCGCNYLSMPISLCGCNYLSMPISLCGCNYLSMPISLCGCNYLSMSWTQRQSCLSLSVKEALEQHAYYYTYPGPSVVWYKLISQNPIDTRPISHIVTKWWLGTALNPFKPTELWHTSHNAPVPNPTMHHFVTEMCTCVHISVTKWYIMGYLYNALQDFWDGSNEVQHEPHDSTKLFMLLL